MPSAEIVQELGAFSRTLNLFRNKLRARRSRHQTLEIVFLFCFYNIGVLLRGPLFWHTFFLWMRTKSKHRMELTSKKTILVEVVSLALLSWFKQIKVAVSGCLLATVAFAPLNNQVLFHTHFILYRSRDIATKRRMESTSQNTFLGRKQPPSLALSSFWKQD